jgi:hypothetical protein
MVQHTKICKYNTAYKQNQGQNPLILSIDAEKVFGTIQHPFMIKALTKVGIETVLQHNKVYMQQSYN